MSHTIAFGTDGWRAVMAEEFTFANVRLCAQGVATYLHDRGTASRGLVVGYDTRFASERFAGAVAEVLAANDIPVYLTAAFAPTPAISYSIIARRAAGAAIITASHNPAEWNGFKYKPEYAGSASPEVVASLEERIEAARAGGEPPRMALPEARRRGLVQMIDPKGPYTAHLATLVDVERLRRAGLRIVVDPMFGTGMGYLAGLLQGGATQVVEVHAERNPLFPGLERPEPIAPNLGALREEVLRRGFSVGVATDGDADRLGAVDEHGRPLTPLQLFALLAFYLLEVRGERGPLVKSVTSSNMIDRLGEIYGVPVYQTPVGFKFLGPRMMETNALMGGEESGGFGFRGHIPERDGILSALCLLDALARTGRTVSDLLAWLYRAVGPHHYDRRDLAFPPDQQETIRRRVAAAEPASLQGVEIASISTMDGFRFDLRDGSWVLVRFSGTEPLLRVYAEASTPDRVQDLLRAGRELAGL
ncbi:MAG: phosphoglucomutase/phosphomannomutase family protein [Chloroflexi bacterium]|nr:phosphoglucomutase/phosphomannomutase family protein [Chloroflexota bacterium]